MLILSLRNNNIVPFIELYYSGIPLVLQLYYIAESSYSLSIAEHSTNSIH
jgi:hypothetical protein